jgi:hypothetical protein
MIPPSSLALPFRTRPRPNEPDDATGTLDDELILSDISP